VGTGYRTTLNLVLVSMIAMSASSAVPAQEPTGAVEGTVTDPQGAVLQNVSVSARNVATNFAHTATTGDDGHYRIAQLWR
jgi:hypothetical protein